MADFRKMQAGIARMQEAGYSDDEIRKAISGVMERTRAEYGGEIPKWLIPGASGKQESLPPARDEVAEARQMIANRRASEEPSVLDELVDQAKAVGRQFAGGMALGATPQRRFEQAKQDELKQRTMGKVTGDQSRFARANVAAEQARDMGRSAELMAENPKTAVALQIGGAAAGGAFLPTPFGKSMPKGALGVIDRGLTTGAVYGGAEAGANAQWNPEEVVEGAKTGLAMGGALSATAAGAGKAIGAVKNRLSDPRTITGEHIQALEKAKQSGYLDSPEFKNLREGQRGIGEAAGKYGGEIGEIQARRYSDANRAWEEGMTAIPGRDVPVDVGPVHRAAKAQVKRFSNKRVANPDVQSAASEVQANLSRDVPQFVPDDMGTPGLVPVSRGRKGNRLPPGPNEPPATINMREAGTANRPLATLDDLILQKQMLKEKAEWGTAATKENRPYRQMHRAIVDAIEEINPEMAKVDRQFMEAAEKLERSNAVIFGKENANVVTDSVAARRRAAGELQQLVKDTQASGTRIQDFDELALDPELAPLIDKMKAKTSYESTRFGSPNVQGHPGKWLLQLPSQNWNAFASRMLYPAAKGGEKAAAGAGNPLVRAAVAERERRRAR